MPTNNIKPDIIVETKNVHKWFGKNHVLRGINFKVYIGETVVICGPSGSGKSTFIRTFNGLEPIQKGEIYVAGYKVHSKKISLRQLRREVGIVFQHFNLFPHLTVINNITLALCRAKYLKKKEAEKIAYQFLEKVRLEDKAKEYPSSLSGGQRQRVAIVRSLAMNPKLMLFDEPTSALDPELIGDVLNLMEELSREGMTMIVITHELGFAEHVADRVIFFDEGNIREEGETKKMIHNPTNKRTKEFMGQIGIK
jgi:ABC-type polar amino acid transport system ATPase subunit